MPVPKVMAPSMKVTVPVGVRPVTVAVKVVAWPAVTGLGVAVSVVLLLAVLTPRLIAAEVLPALFASPPYTADRLRVPAVL